MKKFAIASAAMITAALASTTQAENLSGPRLGMTYVTQKTIDYARDQDVKLNSFLTQFGWQFEKTFFTTNEGPQGVTALVPLIGGADQGLLLPSLSWVTGLRSGTGYEFVVGPNISVGGVGLTAALGRTFRSGEVNFPINLSIVSNENGLRTSLLFGFNSVSQQ